MCYSTKAQPPLSEPAAGANTAFTAHLLTSSDGAAIAACTAVAQPAAIPDSEQMPTLGVVVLPDIRGIAPFYEELCRQLASNGYPATAVDWHGRSAGTDLRARAQPFPEMHHLAALSRPQMQDDVMAAAAHLGRQGCDRVVALGFCMGGRVAFLMSAERFGLAGVIGYYGAPGATGPYDSGPTGVAHELSAPILAIFGEADEGITPAAIAEFDEALTTAAVPHEIVTYAGAGHGFFDVAQAEHAAASAASWRRVVAFLRVRQTLV